MKGPQFPGDFREEHDSLAAALAMYIEELHACQPNTEVKIDMSLFTVQSHEKKNTGCGIKSGINTTFLLGIPDQSRY